MAKSTTGCSSSYKDYGCSFGKRKGKQYPSALQGSAGASPSRLFTGRWEARGWRKVRPVVHQATKITVVRLENARESNVHRRCKAPRERRPPVFIPALVRHGDGEKCGQCDPPPQMPLVVRSLRPDEDRENGGYLQHVRAMKESPHDGDSTHTFNTIWQYENDSLGTRAARGRLSSR